MIPDTKIRTGRAMIVFLDPPPVASRSSHPSTTELDLVEGIGFGEVVGEPNSNDDSSFRRV